MPLYPDLSEALSSRVADFNNIAKVGTGGGSITAALFLKKFIQKPTHWAHFDIAGVMVKGNGGKMTGEPTRGLTNLIENISSAESKDV